MKLFYVFLFCFTNGVTPTKGQLHLELSGEMLLRFVFHPNYNYHEKSCCKFTSYGCIIFVTSSGYVHNAYEGRIDTYTYPGAFDVRIWNVRAKDAGTYRCEIHGMQKYIYQDFHVAIADSETELNPILAFPKSTISPVSSVHHLLDKPQEISSNTRNLEFILGAIFGIGVIIIGVTLTVVYYKKKSRDKCGRSLPSLPNINQQIPQELIYTTVEFKTSNIYSNLDIHSSRPDPGYVLRTQDRVEYATIAGVL